MEQLKTFDLATKRKLLAQAQEQLKKEFFGIDFIIDAIIKQVASWYFFPDLQERPVVINLWGLTGVGKTALVERLVFLLEQSDYYYRFDMGMKDHSYTFSEGVKELFDSNILYPKIIVLDEFQHARTKDENAFESATEENRLIWDFIDSGILSLFVKTFQDNRTTNQFYRMTSVINNGVEIEAGKVTKRKDLFIAEFKSADLEDEEIEFFPDRSKKLFEDYFESINETNTDNYFAQLNTAEALNLIEKALFFYNRPKVKSFSNSLIFVIGNLDEAFDFSNNFSQYIEADEFYRTSKRIDIHKVKKALQKRFRNEQISRLGNTHFIYPSLPESAYYQIIRKELDRFKASIFEKLGIYLEIDAAVEKLIYRLGVFPTQGARPVFTTINNTIKSTFYKFISDVTQQEKTYDTVILLCEQDYIVCKAMAAGNVVFKHHEKCTSDVIPKERSDRKAIVAVHETGHAIIMARLFATVPNVICILDNVDSGQLGFVYSNELPKLLVKSELTKMVAIALGGYLAEKLVFGEENVSIGAQNDIEKATELLILGIKEYGFTGSLLKYKTGTLTDSYALDDNRELNHEILKFYNNAYALAEKLLAEQKQFLIDFSKKLLEQQVIYRHQMEADFAPLIAGNLPKTKSNEGLLFTPLLMNCAVNNK